MAIKPINFYDVVKPPEWANLSDSVSSPEVLGDGWSVVYTVAPGGAQPTSSGWPTSGDAAWVDEQNAAQKTHYQVQGAGWAKLKIIGPPNTNFSFEAFGTAAASGRVCEVRLNGGASSTMDVYENSSETTVLTGATDSSGEAFFEFRGHSSSTGAGYLSAARVIPIEGPKVILADDLQPGKGFTATAENFGSAPVTPATVSDGTTTISVPVTVTGTGPYTITGTMPALADNGTSPMFGQVTLELVTA